MTITLYDSIIANWPSDAVAIAGYVGGSWPSATFSEFGAHKARYKLTIAINAYERARCLDIEQGDARPNEAPNWFVHYADRSQGKPIIYCSASVVSTVRSAMRAAGIGDDLYFVWSAHYGFQHICGADGYPRADGTQWTSSSRGLNLDESLVNDYVFGAPPVVDPHHYAWFSHDPKAKVDERSVVLHYDGARKHPIAYAAYLLYLRRQLRGLAYRVQQAAYASKPHDWRTHQRGWRYQELIQRANGRRVA